MELADKKKLDPTSWSHVGRFEVDVKSSEEVLAHAERVANADVSKDCKKQPTMPLMFYKTEEGEWCAVRPQTNNARQQGQLEAKTTLTLRKYEQRDRLRAKLEAKKRAKGEG